MTVLDLVKSIARKARGVLGLGLVGGVVGLLGGGAWGFLATLLETGLFWDSGYWSFVLTRAVNSATYWALPAAFASSGFGVLVATLDGRRSLGELPLWRMALFGAVGGSLFIPAYLYARFGLTSFAHFPFSLWPQIGVFGLLGGGLTLSLTAVAKREHQAELRAVQQVAALAARE